VILDRLSWTAFFDRFYNAVHYLQVVVVFAAFFDRFYNAAHYLQVVVVFATCLEDRARWECSFLSCKQQFQGTKALYIKTRVLCLCSVSEEHILLAAMANPIFYFSSCLFLSIVIILVKFFHKVWWTPIRIQSSMKSQGIKGPSYRFLHGNTKEIINMISKIRSSPKEVLHHTFPIIQPHIYSWIKLYGNNLLIL
jgi:hypothetical protein